MGQMLQTVDRVTTIAKLDVTPNAGPAPFDCRTMLSRIADNALKYSDQPQTRIMLRSAPDHQTIIEVSDDGPGMTTQELARTFAPFHRGHAAGHRQIPGSGLGLHLARQLAHWSDITLDVRSAPGTGATFTVSLGT